MQRLIEKVSNSIHKLNKIIISNGHNVELPHKIIIRRVSLTNSNAMFQAEEFFMKKVIHKNITEQELVQYLATSIEKGNYRQYNLFFLDAEIMYKLTKKGKVLLSEKQVSGKLIIGENNRKKSYILEEGMDIPIMRELGIFTKENRISKSMYDKFKQINRFVEIIDDRLKDYNKEHITILDFGCGKSYLTFVIYYYLLEIRRIIPHIIGYDINIEVVNTCNELTDKYNYEDIEFVVADVSLDKLYDGSIDMVVSLHACDTATDYALYFAITNKVKYIFSVPCCQHEINSMISIANGDCDIMLGHGLIKERFSSLLTDSVRAEILSQCGYDVDVLEFVDFSHSPKNIMLRAIKKNKGAYKFDKTIQLLDKYNAKQTLLQLMLNRDRDSN